VIQQHRFFIVTFLAALALPLPLAAQEFEAAPVFAAEDVFPRERLEGPGYKVEPTVQNDGFANFFTVTTPDGSYEIESADLLWVRIDEFRKLEIMKEVSGTGEYATAMGEAAKAPFVFAKDMITSPIQTTGGVFRGIGSFFSNVGHGLFGSPSEEEEGVVKRLLAFDATKRAYAGEFQVDPYSTNEPMQDRLKDLSWASFAGGMTTGVATSFIGGTAGMVIDVTSFGGGMNGLVYDNNPPKLKSINRDKLKAMGVDDEIATVFLDHPNYTPTRKTWLVGALEQMEGVENRGVAVDVATLAANDNDAFYWQRSAEMAAAYHANVGPVARFVRLGEAVVLQTPDGRIIAPFPNDYLAWTEDNADAATLIDQDDAGKSGEGIAGKEMWFAGDVSPLARTKLEELGWTVQANKKHELQLP